MKQRRVVTTPEADDDARRIDEWWIQNRGAAPNLFLEELADALALLGLGPASAYDTRIERFPAFAGTCSGQAATTCTLSFVHSDALVVIVGIWGATRRTTPRFRARAASTKAGLAAPDDAPEQ